MNRYRLDMLENREGRLFLRGKPYTGIAYEVIGERVAANHRVIDGLRDGPAEVWDEPRTRVLLEALLLVEPDDINEHYPQEGDYYDGVPFEGVAYHFDEDTGMLREETDFRPNPVGPCRTWFDTGELASHSSRRRPDGSSVSELYFPDGEVHSFQGDNIRWSQTDRRRLRTLSLSPGYPESDLRPAPLAVDTTLLSLSGKGVTDEILERLTGLESLEELFLDATGITGKGLNSFRVCSKLRKLLTYPRNDFTEADVQQLLTSLPECQWTNRTQ